MREARQRIVDMLQAINKIQSHAGLNEAQFRTDEVLQGFVAYQLMILGEAAFKMPQNVRARFPEIPWKSIEGMRHVLVHGYFSIDLDSIWGVVQRDLPVLKPRLEHILIELQ